MSYEFYKVLHILGIAAVFMASGAQVSHVLRGGTKDDDPARSLVLASHGLGLVIALVAGFGMHAKLGVDGFPGWFVGKLLLWLFLGGAVALPYRNPALAKPLWGGLVVVAALATWLAAFKPF